MKAFNELSLSMLKSIVNKNSKDKKYQLRKDARFFSQSTKQ
jgi:hypothetical protein